jgi:hypothetical protein
MKIDVNDSRLRPEDKRTLLRIAAALAREDATPLEPLTATELYSREAGQRALPYVHHKVDRGDK